MSRLKAFWIVLPILALGWYQAAQLALGQLIQLQPAPPTAVKPEVTPDKNAPISNATRASQLSAIKRVDNSELRSQIDAARDYVKAKNWDVVVTVLQRLLDQKEDTQVQIRDKDASGNDSLRWTSVRNEANNILASMAKEGMEAYEVHVGAKAREKLAEAKKTGDKELLAEVGQRYRHSKSGREANELLATLALARGQHFMAALYFDKILEVSEHAPPSDMTLFKAALAYKRAGDEGKAEAAWKKLETAVKEAGSMKVGDDHLSLSKLSEILHSDIKSGEVATLLAWPMMRGNLSHTAQAVGSPPLLDQNLWRHRLFEDTPTAQSIYSDRRTKEVVDNAIQQMVSLKHPVLSGSFPVVTQGKVFLRSFRGIKAYHMQGGTTAKGNKFEAGDLFFDGVEDRASLTYLLNTTETKMTVEQWLSQYSGAFAGATSMVYENSLIGTLSTDHRFVYAISDLALPPFPQQQMSPFGGIQSVPYSGELRKYVYQNELQAFSVFDGKLKWVLGGTQDDKQFGNSHFLGVPISVGGKLYVLNEKGPNTNNQVGDAELRLVCIDPNKPGEDPHRPFVVDPILSLGILQQQNRVTHQASRRTNAVHLAFSDGVLVCPTNAGEIFGIDLLTRCLIWSYPYRESVPADPSNMNPGMILPGGFGRRPATPVLGNMMLTNWKSAPPAIVEGKVIFTAPDAQSVHCVNLRDGTPVWKSKQQEGDLYFAGAYGSKALIVGKNMVRALEIKTGGEAWRITTGDLPSGQGVASKNIYYLPLRKGEILALDVEKGTVKAHNRAASENMVPGNLVFHDGAVVSITPSELAAYPQLTSRLELARKAVGVDPQNLEKRAELGELLLKDGQTQAAVVDLLAVVDSKPEAKLATRAKDRLFEALTDLFQIDFKGAADKYLKNYEELVTTTENGKEKQKRQATFFELMGQGREAEGNLVEAFRMYREFGSLPIHNEEGGVTSLQDPSHRIPTHVWLRGRISNMMAKARPDQREPLEKEISQEWKNVEAKKDLDAMRSFVGMFDVPFRVGREARLRLAETILERNERNSFLEAELYLHHLRGSPYKAENGLGGMALANLALLEEKKGNADSMRLAAEYYRELGEQFAKVKVRSDRTGSDLFNDLATDKRFLAFLEEPRSPWGNVKLAAREVPGRPMNVTGGMLGFLFHAEGDHTPFARHHRLMIDPSGNPANPSLRLVDAQTNTTRWSQNLGASASNTQIYYQLYQQQGMTPRNSVDDAPHRRFQVKGHLLVCQVGIMAYCLDGDTGKILWKESLAPGMESQQNISQVMLDKDGLIEVIIWNPQGNRQMRMHVGHVGEVQASYVALITSQGMIVNDPLRGNLMWKKPEISVNSRVFGDEQNIFVVDGLESSDTGVGRAFRAIDGVALQVPDFATVYQHRVRVSGNQILAFKNAAKDSVLYLYDVLTGKEIWSKSFPVGSTVAKTEDSKLAAVVGADGMLTVVDSSTGAEVFSATVFQGRIGPEDVKGLKNPYVVADAERFYVFLNKPAEAAKGISNIASNFQSNMRNIFVNGWIMALHRTDGTNKAGAWKKGDLHWHSFRPIENQMLIAEMLDQTPIFVFSSRYLEMIAGGRGNRWWAYTQSINKRTGKMIYDPGPMSSNSIPQFVRYLVDPRRGTIELHGVSNAIQHYIDDGKNPPDLRTSGLGTTNDTASITPPVPAINGIVPQVQGVRPVLRIAPGAIPAIRRVEVKRAPKVEEAPK